jgi:hypothetical protein
MTMWHGSDTCLIVSKALNGYNMIQIFKIKKETHVI